ncbi:hypothetical protein [Deinococcus aquaedulcis]|uniref:hypothetical protein n=1 Tax=Deinococcus aquaedulcis TaxID=2840455 RepID=UPI001C833E31|nr:hypothetical protein [Deinococcus aquaedulcis]
MAHLNVSSEGVNYIYIDPNSIELPEIFNSLVRVSQKAGDLIRRADDCGVIVFSNNPYDYPAAARIILFEINIESFEMRKLYKRDIQILQAAFKKSIITHFLKMNCSVCKTELDTLVVDGGDGYPGKPDLLRQKMMNFRPLLCPMCQSSLRSYVVKIFRRSE